MSWNTDPRALLDFVTERKLEDNIIIGQLRRMLMETRPRPVNENDLEKMIQRYINAVQEDYSSDLVSNSILYNDKQLLLRILKSELDKMNSNCEEREILEIEQLVDKISNAVVSAHISNDLEAFKSLKNIMRKVNFIKGQFLTGAIQSSECNQDIAYLNNEFTDVISS
ncbi:hypothetical protein [Clostridium perfringens]|uniref:hypothetical protein n=1 Tax=Clostridium perfringens TaxID=1502 RepID=UPI0008A6ADB8|nr:hypothetical protein [Clostridium perfringens]AOY53682.1 hypothetical protein FORC25_1266 [Clostridium perfringens]MDU1212415.1 hypothetical protein [Clostridium perfringens]HBI7336943.1 hypothetical protein [Clostridium perfringens]